VFVAVDLDQLVSFLVELYEVKTTYLCQSLDKMLKYVAVVFQFGIQSTVFETGVLASGTGSRKPSLDWIKQMIIFFMCPMLFVFLITTVLTFCRPKPAIEGRTDGCQVLARHRPLSEGMVLVLGYLTTLFIFMQYFLSALSSYLETGSLEPMKNMALTGLAVSGVCLLVFYLRRHSFK